MKTQYAEDNFNIGALQYCFDTQFFEIFQSENSECFQQYLLKKLAIFSSEELSQVLINKKIRKREQSRSLIQDK